MAEATTYRIGPALHVVAAEVAGRIVAGDATVSASGHGGGRFSTQQLIERWQVTAEAVLDWLRAHESAGKAPADTSWPQSTDGLKRDYGGAIRNPYEQP